MYFHYFDHLLLNHSVYRAPEIHDCSPWIPLNIAIPYELLVCIRYTLAFLGLVSFYLSLSPFSHWKSTLPWPRRASLSLQTQIEREREREREENGRNETSEWRGKILVLLGYIYPSVSVSTSRRSCTEDLVVRATRERSSGSLHRSLHRGARSFARLTRQCRITSRIIPRVGT